MDRTGRVDRSEGGASLPEMLVALFVLAVGIAGAASMFAVAGRTAAATEDRGAMERLALSELETLRALDGSVLGIDPAAEGYRPEVDGRVTVTEPDTNLVEPLSRRRIVGSGGSGGLEVEIRRDVTWVDTDNGALTVLQAYKLLSVRVAWTDGAGSHEVSVEGPASLGADPGAAG